MGRITKKLEFLGEEDRQWLQQNLLIFKTDLQEDNLYNIIAMKTGYYLHDCKDLLWGLNENGQVKIGYEYDKKDADELLKMEQVMPIDITKAHILVNRYLDTPTSYPITRQAAMNLWRRLKKIRELLESWEQSYLIDYYNYDKAQQIRRFNTIKNQETIIVDPFNVIKKTQEKPVRKTTRKKPVRKIKKKIVKKDGTEPKRIGRPKKIVE